MMNVLADFQPDEIVILGDYADFYEVMSHQRHPRVQITLEDEVNAVNHELDQIDSTFPDAKKKFIEGNHEDRLERYIINQAPALFGVTETSRLFKLDTRPNWQFFKWSPTQQCQVLNSKLWARHRPPSNNPRLNAKEAGCNIVYGDIHKIEHGYHTSLLGDERVAFSVGWLGDKSLDKIFGYVKNTHQWQLGFGIVYVVPETGHFYHQIIPITEDGTCIFNGKFYRA